MDWSGEHTASVQTTSRDTSGGLSAMLTGYMPGKPVYLPGKLVYLSGKPVYLPCKPVYLPGKPLYLPGKPLYLRGNQFIWTTG